MYLMLYFLLGFTAALKRKKEKKFVYYFDEVAGVYVFFVCVFFYPRSRSE